MGRKVSDDLFLLIQSLTRTEKRYFKIFSKRHTIGEGNKYVRLFDAVERQKQYNETELLHKNSWINPRLFPDQKNHLYGLILRALVVYSSEKSSESVLRFQLSCFDLLHRKGLHAQCRKIILKTKATAKRLEKLLLYIECLEREKKLELVTFTLKTSAKKLEKINAEIEAAIAQLETDQQYSRLSEEMYVILTEEQFIRSEKNKKRSRKVISHPLMKQAPSDGSFHSLFNFHRAHSLYCYSHADFKGFYTHCRALVEMIERFPGILVETPKAYIVAYQNLLIAQKNLRLFDELFITLRRLKKYESVSPEMMGLIFAISHDIELTIYIDTGQFEKGARLAGPISRGLEQNKGYVSIPHEVLFYFNVTYNFIGCGKYRDAMMWLNKMFNHPQSAAALPNVFHMASLVSLLVYYELGLTDLLEYRIKSFTRTFSKKHALYELENILLGFFSKAIITSDKKAMEKLVQRLYRDLEKLHNDPETRRAFTTFNFLAWARSKVTGKSMSEIVQETEI